MAVKNTTRVKRYDLVSPMIPCKDEILEKFERFLMSGQYILGDEVRLLEEGVVCSHHFHQVSALVGDYLQLFYQYTIDHIVPLSPGWRLGRPKQS